jgi:hypothetical protein
MPVSSRMTLCCTFVRDRGRGWLMTEGLSPSEGPAARGTELLASNEGRAPQTTEVPEHVEGTGPRGTEIRASNERRAP